jgi:hypothetical protein
MVQTHYYHYSGIGRGGKRICLEVTISIEEIFEDGCLQYVHKVYDSSGNLILAPWTSNSKDSDADVGCKLDTKFGF